MISSEIVFQIFLGRVVSYVAPSFQVVGSEDYSALTRDPEQVMPITLNDPLNLTVKFCFNRLGTLRMPRHHFYGKFKILNFSAKILENL